MNEPRLLRRSHVYAGRIVDIGIETVELPNGVECDLEIIRHPGGSAVAAIDGSGRICLLRQYRHAAGAWIWEIPAGCIDAGEAPETTAKRELEEEAGMNASEWRSLGTMLSSPGVFTEVVHLYLARGLSDVGMSAGEDEVFEVVWTPLDDALRRVSNGDIVDAKTVIALFRVRDLLNAT